MILNDKTKDKFGYCPEDLSSGSHKKIVLLCDYCNTEFETTRKLKTVGDKKLSKDCCYDCRARKREEISLIQHGVKNPFQREEVKKKSRKTCLEKYGVEHSLQSEIFMDKVRQTCLDKYGVENVFQLEEVKDKQKQTCLEKYGVENVSSNPDIQEKRKQTNKERFGHEYYIASKDCRKATKEKFGVDNVFELEETKEKIRQTNIEIYGVDHRLKVPELAKTNGEKSKQTKIDNGQIRVFMDQTVSEWAEEIGFSSSRFNVLVGKYGWDMAVNMTPRMSYLEKLIETFLTEINVNFNKQVKLGNYYADFVIDKLIIECDGMFWHSEKHKQNNYHVKKRDFYVQSGYKPLFFRENEISDKFDIVKSVIINHLKLNDKIYARKCDLLQIDKQDAAEFFDKNHLMGRGKGNPYALLVNGEIVSCIQINRNEISRFCNKLNTSVVGGFSRLLNHTRKFHQNIFTFIDLRYGDGEYLTNFGFIKGKAYPSFKWTNGNVIVNRMKFPSNTGYEHGFYKIWDCGQLKYCSK